VVVGGCDKNMPGGMIGIARINVPGIYVYGGTIKPGSHKGRDLNIVSVFEAVGEFTMGRMSQEDFKAATQSSATRHHHTQVARKCCFGDYGDWRFNQRSAALSCHRARC
jgi:dihydroxyacid dehydratase/phosphogluconate dehydratase